MNRRLIAYTARTDNGPTDGVATVITDRTRSSWHEAAAQIPGFVTGRGLGAAPMYTLRYDTDGQTVTRQLDASGVEKIGTVVMRVTDRTGGISNIAVLDSNDADVTFDFACFRG